jgi:hypothetical protein
VDIQGITLGRDGAALCAAMSGFSCSNFRSSANSLKSCCWASSSASNRFSMVQGNLAGAAGGLSAAGAGIAARAKTNGTGNSIARVLLIA